MDVQMSLLAIGVACATAVAVYLVSVFGIREKSFEEAIAEQKKRSDDLLGTQHHHHHKKEKKKPGNKDKNSNKKLKKREKLNNNAAAAATIATVNSSDLSDGGGSGDQPTNKEVEEDTIISTKAAPEVMTSSNKRSHVEIVDEPEILDEDEDADEDEAGDGDEQQQALQEKAPPRNTASRRSSVSSMRRDSVIKSILLNKDEVPSVSSKEPAEAANHFDQIVPKDDCELKKSNSELQLSTPPSPKAGDKQNTAPASGSNTPVEENSTTDSPQVSKRSRSKQKKSQEDDTMTAPKIEKVIDRLPLTSSEIQQLIDVLLNKQHAGDSEWINKGANNRDSVGGLKKQLELKDKQISEEQATVNTLQSKLKDLRNEFSAEKSKWAGVRRTLEEQVTGKVSEVQNLQLRLRQVGDLSMNEKGELQKQLHRMQIKFKDVQEEYEAMKADYRNYREAEQTVRSKADTLERESGALKTQCGHLENQLKNAFASNQEMSNQLRSLQDHVRVLEERKKNDEMLRSNEFRKLQDREAVLLQELATLKTTAASTENENRDLRNQLNILESTVKTHDEVNKKYEELRKSELQLRNLVNELKGTVSTLEDNLSSKDRQLNDLELENQRITSEGTKLNGDVQAEIDGIKKQLELQVNGNNLLQTQLNELNKQLHDKNNKNDELRHKNQKLVESLNVTEQTLQSKIEANEKARKQEEDNKTRVTGLIHQILGDSDSSSVDLCREDWLVSVLSRVQEKVTALENSTPAALPEQDPAELVELKQHNTKLEEEVVHYQGMLKQTENLLSTLQASINVEEAKWVKENAEKDKEIERLRSANTVLKELEQEKLILEDQLNELQAKKEEQQSNNSSPDPLLVQQIEQLKNSNASLQAELDTTKSKCDQLSSALSNLEAAKSQQQVPPAAEPYTNGSTTAAPPPPCEPYNNSNNELVSKQLSPPVSPKSTTTTQPPPSPNPSASSPGSTGKEKKKKKGSSRK